MGVRPWASGDDDVCDMYSTYLSTWLNDYGETLTYESERIVTNTPQERMITRIISSVVLTQSVR